jgi:phenylacetate-coenzyme A ligase PaaK-like adenylate-forming protein
MTAPTTTFYERFLELLTRGASKAAGDREAVRARYGERFDSAQRSHSVVISRDEWILNQIDLALALGRLLVEDDVVVSAVPYELSFIGAEVDRAIEMIGASVISVGTSRTICPMPRLLNLLEQYEVTALVCSPSFATELASLAVSLGQRPEDSSIRSIICVGDPCSKGRLDSIGAAWGATTSAFYGTPSTPTVAVACEHGALHLCDHRLRATVRDGLRGELLLGSADSGAPGGATGELVELWPAERRCACGAASTVLIPLGSVAESVPTPAGPVSAVDVERVVFEQAGLSPHFACAARDGRFIVTCATTAVVPIRIGMVQRSIENRIREALGVDAEVTLVDVKHWSTATS